MARFAFPLSVLLLSAACALSPNPPTPPPARPLIAATALPSASSTVQTTTGSLTGIVRFIGLACPPTAPQKPPCDSPYPDYPVTVHAADGTTVVAQTRTTADGRYRVDLPPGTYLITTQAGAGNQTQTSAGTVAPGSSTVLDLRVDTGIR